MVKRRNILLKLGVIGGITSIAGCSAQNTDDNQEPETVEEEVEESEPASSGPEQISMDSVQFLYGFSSGLTARMRLRYQAESGSQRTRVEIEAYSDDTLIDSNSRWEDLGAGLSSEVELTIEALGPLENHDLDDLTEFVITGRPEGGEDAEIASYSGDEIRSRVDD